MKPSHCAICDKHERDAIRLEFYKGPDDHAWDYRVANYGVLGTPPYVAWFCNAHAPFARALVHMSLRDALAELHRRAKEGGLRTSAPSTWEALTGYSGLLPEELRIKGQRWVLVDSIDVGDMASENEHDFFIGDAEEVLRVEREGIYADGVDVKDRGRLHVGGYAEFTINNLTPGRMLAVYRRCHYPFQTYRVALEIGGAQVGSVQCVSENKEVPWRNVGLWVNAEHVVAPQLTVRHALVGTGVEVDAFRFWFYQPSDAPDGDEVAGEQAAATE